MALPQQKRFSLDETVNYVQLETGVPHSKEGLFDLAKHGNFGICFYVRDEDLKFIQLDKENDKWQSVPCAPLLGKDSLKKIVIPVDNPNQENHFSMTLNPREERIFPILEGRALQQTADNLENEIITIMPWRVSATDSNTLLSIAIIKNRHINGNDSLDVNKYIEWQKERDLPIYNPDIKTNSLIKPIVRHSDNGNFKYFETKSTMEIKRSDLCVTYKALENYIKTVRINNIKLDEPYYSLKDARTKIKEIAKKKVKPHNLIKLAESGKIRLSIHKPDWKYVRIDEQGQEMEIMPRKILDEETIYLIVPRSGFFKDTNRFNKKGLVAGTGTENYSLLYGDSTDRTIYPFFDPKHFKSRTNEKKLYIYTHDMEAKYKNQTIKVSKVTKEIFPEKGDSNYPTYMKWLRDNLSFNGEKIYLDDNGLLDHRMYFNSDNFYVLGGQWKGRGFEIAESDLVITRHELGDYILSIMDAPSRSLPLQETISYQPPVTTELNIIDPKTISQLFYEFRIANSWKGKNDSGLIKDVVKAYLSELEKACKDSRITYEQGLEQLIRKTIGDTTNDYFEVLVDMAESKLATLRNIKQVQAPEQVKSPNEQVQAPEQVESTKKKSPTADGLRLEKLKIWLEEQPDTFDPFNHEYIKLEVWKKAQIAPKSQSTINRFFCETQDLISFKAGKRSKPIQTCSEKIKLDKNNPAIFPLK